jgi:hypothetical protein
MFNSTEIKQTYLIQLTPLFIAFLITTFALNVYIIVIISINKKLHIAVNLFTGSLCVCALLSSCLSMPLQFLYLKNNYQWYYSLDLCILWYIIDFSLCTISLLNLIVITFIRYMYIVKPHNYWMTKKLLIFIFCLVWFVPLIAWTATLYILFPRSQPHEDCYFSASLTILIIADLIAFVIPLIILTAINLKLIWVLKKRSTTVFCLNDVSNIKIMNRHVFVTQLERQGNNTNGKLNNSLIEYLIF